jgi:hypothetical protein
MRSTGKYLRISENDLYSATEVSWSDTKILLRVERPYSDVISTHLDLPVSVVLMPQYAWVGDSRYQADTIISSEIRRPLIDIMERKLKELL